MKKFLLFTFSLLIAVVILAYQAIRLSPGDLKFKPGDKIESMVVTTGTAEAPPLWAFCSPTRENDNIISVDCRIPPLPKLAIGQPFDGADQALQASDWSALTWELYLDGYPLDLEAFGSYHYVVPDLAPSPSPIREVFRQVKAWDVVLVNPTSGKHTLHGTASTEADTYTWVVNFTIERSLIRNSTHAMPYADKRALEKQSDYLKVLQMKSMRHIMMYRQSHILSGFSLFLRQDLCNLLANGLTMFFSLLVFRKEE